ncbi:MAG: cupin, partial [Loktanella sp.]|nr:cupin [Loktanella sp.]
MTDASIRAEVVLPTTDLRADLGFFANELRMRLDMIYPADDPTVAVFSGHGLRVRLEQREDAAGHLRLMTDAPWTKAALTAPGGTRVSVHPLNPPLDLPATEHAFV